MTSSVLMSTYYKEEATYLDAALSSIWSMQTRKPDEIVLVEDGELTPELYDTVSSWQSRIGDRLTIVSKSCNEGLAKALNSGLSVAKGDVIVRMDSDDLSYPDRIEKELSYLEFHPDVDVVGSWISEFIDTQDNVVSIRKVPESHSEIYRFGQSRNPMNHPSVAFRRKRILSHGGYVHCPLFEDYHLWATLLQDGYRFHNIQEPLLWFRTSRDMYARRGGWRYAITEMSFQMYLHRIGYISAFQCMKNIPVRFLGRVLPNSVRKLIYQSLMRK